VGNIATGVGVGTIGGIGTINGVACGVAGIDSGDGDNKGEDVEVSSAAVRKDGSIGDGVGEGGLSSSSVRSNGWVGDGERGFSSNSSSSRQSCAKAAEGRRGRGRRL
jgi:hypothetical protein